jgi:uncharacterized protein (TIGR02598 family)
MKKLSPGAAFSLVELTLALGVAAFCLIAVFGLMPVGIQTNRNATSQTAATDILSSVVSDIRGSLPGQNNSAIYKINRRKTLSWTLCFDGQEKPTGTPMSGDVACTNSNSVFRLYVKMGNNPGSAVYPNYAYLRMSWPALASPSAKPSGSVETVAAYFVQ